MGGSAKIYYAMAWSVLSGARCTVLLALQDAPADAQDESSVVHILLRNGENLKQFLRPVVTVNAGGPRYTTQAARHSINPVWNVATSLSVDKGSDCIAISVHDKQSGDHHPLTAILKLSSLPDGQPKDLRCVLRVRDGAASSSAEAALHLTAMLVQPTGAGAPAGDLVSVLFQVRSCVYQDGTQFRDGYLNVGLAAMERPVPLNTEQVRLRSGCLVVLVVLVGPSGPWL